MSRQTEAKAIGCRQARKMYGAGDRPELEDHLKRCARCAREYRIHALGQTALRMAASSEPVVPDNDFFIALRARLARGPAQAAPASVGAFADESWTAVLSVTARQLIPAMAMLLVLILGATFISDRLWPANEVLDRPRDRVVLSDVLEYPEPTADDVLETLVAMEDAQDGR